MFQSLKLERLSDEVLFIANFSLLDFLIPQRYVLGIMGFMAIVNAYTMRISLSVAITEMVLPLNVSEHHDPDACPAESTNSTRTIIVRANTCIKKPLHLRFFNSMIGQRQTVRLGRKDARADTEFLLLGLCNYTSSWWNPCGKIWRQILTGFGYSFDSDFYSSYSGHCCYV